MHPILRLWVRITDIVFWFFMISTPIIVVRDGQWFFLIVYMILAPMSYYQWKRSGGLEAWFKLCHTCGGSGRGRPYGDAFILGLHSCFPCESCGGTGRDNAKS